ncbi:MAG: adenylate/guanylate cyclase domain-containing protein [Candidatus Margulisiibacteriota bacterium]|jgi:class 3 adenylate cyclase
MQKQSIFKIIANTSGPVAGAGPAVSRVNLNPPQNIADAVSALSAQGMTREQIRAFLLDQLTQCLERSSQYKTEEARQFAKGLEARIDILKKEILAMITSKASIDHIYDFVLNKVVKEMGFSAGYLWDISQAGPGQKDRLPADILQRYLDDPQSIFQLTYGTFLVTAQERGRFIEDYSPEKQEKFKKLQNKLGTDEKEISKLRDQLTEYVNAPIKGYFGGWFMFIERINRFLTVKLAKELGIVDVRDEENISVSAEDAKALAKDPEILFQLLIEECQKPAPDKIKTEELKQLWTIALKQNKQRPSKEEEAIMAKFNLVLSSTPERTIDEAPYIQALTGREIKKFQDREIGLFRDFISPSKFDVLGKISANKMAKIRELNKSSVLTRVCLIGEPIVIKNEKTTGYEQDRLLTSIGMLASGATGYMIMPFIHDLLQKTILGEKDVEHVNKRRQDILDNGQGYGVRAYNGVSRFMHFVFKGENEELIDLKLNFAKEICALLHGLMQNAELAGNIEGLKKFMETTLGQSGKKAAENILRRVDAFEKPHREKSNIFFSDVAGFTNFIERMEKAGRLEQAVQILNDYFEEMERVISKYGGDIDKYIGDAIMASFPKGSSEEARRAVFAAIEMQQAIDKLNTELNQKYDLKEELTLTIRVRMGLHGGEPVIVALGAEARRAMTLIGNDVNTAARLEPINDRYGSLVTISGSIADLLDDSVVFVPTDTIIVKGQSDALKIFAVLGKKEDIAAEPQKAELVELYKTSFQFKLEGRYDEAIELFKKIISKKATVANFGIFGIAEYQLKRSKLLQEADRIFLDMSSAFHHGEYDLVLRLIDEQAGKNIELKEVLLHADEVLMLLSESEQKIAERRQIDPKKHDSFTPAMAALREGVSWMARWGEHVQQDPEKGLNHKTASILSRVAENFADSPVYTWMIQRMLKVTRELQGRFSLGSLGQIDQAIYLFLSIKTPEDSPEAMIAEYQKAIGILASAQNSLTTEADAAMVSEMINEINKALTREYQRRHYRSIQQKTAGATNIFLGLRRELQKRIDLSYPAETVKGLVKYLDGEAANYYQSIETSPRLELDSQEKLEKAIAALSKDQYPHTIETLLEFFQTRIKLRAELSKAQELNAQVEGQIERTIGSKDGAPEQKEVLRRLFRESREGLERQVQIEHQLALAAPWHDLYDATRELLDDFPDDPVGLHLLEKIKQRDPELLVTNKDVETFRIVNLFFNWINNPHRPEVAERNRQQFIEKAEPLKGQGKFIDLLLERAQSGKFLRIEHSGVTKAHSKSG